MELKYDIYTLNNAQGTGEKRQYVRIVQHEPMTEKQLQEKIQNRCSLTKGDVAAVLAELHDLLVPEGKLMEEVQRNVHFVRSRYSNQSTKYSEEKMLENIKEYLQKNRYITTRIMRIHFGLTPYMAQKWLNHFCEKGIMEKEGTQHAPIYFLK